MQENLNQEASNQPPVSPIIETPQISESKLSYSGDGKSLFSLYLVNIFLSIITLGLYHPWARAAIMRYNYSHTELEGSRFSFHGTGKEMFVGMLKSLGLLAVLGGVLFLVGYYVHELLAFALYFVAILVVLPLLIVGSLKYKSSRSSWRGIYFQYTGTYSNMFKICAKGFLLSVITFGIYFSFMLVDIYKEVASNLKFGNLKFKFTGDGGEFFFINFKSNFLIPFTLGLYYFKFQSLIYNYVFDHIKLDLDDKRATFRGTTTGRGYLKLGVVNFFMLLFSLGLAFPWVITRNINYAVENLMIKGAIDFNNITQSEYSKGEVIGEELLDVLDIDLA